MDLVANAIIAHFRLNLEAELSLLKSDLAWWNRKFIFKPQLKESTDVEELISSLKTRIDSIESLCTGALTEEFITLAPYKVKSDLTFFL